MKEKTLKKSKPEKETEEKTAVGPSKNGRSGQLLAKKKVKKNTSLRLEKQTLKALKILAIEQETSVQSLIEKLIHAYLKKHQR